MPSQFADLHYQLYGGTECYTPVKIHLDPDELPDHLAPTADRTWFGGGEDGVEFFELHPLSLFRQYDIVRRLPERAFEDPPKLQNLSQEGWSEWGSQAWRLDAEWIKADERYGPDVLPSAREQMADSGDLFPGSDELSPYELAIQWSLSHSQAPDSAVADLIETEFDVDTVLTLARAVLDYVDETLREEIEAFAKTDRGQSLLNQVEQEGFGGCDGAREWTQSQAAFFSMSKKEKHDRERKEVEKNS